MIDHKFYISHGPLFLRDILDGLDVTLPMDGLLDEEITSASALSMSVPGEISFLSSGKYKSDLETAKATACFVTDRLAPLVAERGIVPLISSHPRAHFARALGRLFSERGWESEAKTSPNGNETYIAPSARVHPTAIIGRNAHIGADCVIGPYVTLGPGVIIGAGSRLDPHVDIRCTHIGEACHIQSGAVIGGSGFGVTADGEGIIDIPHIGRVILGKRVRIGAGCCIDRGQLGDTVLGDDVKLDNLVMIGHNVTIGEGTMMAALVGIPGSCEIGKGAIFGGQAGIADHVKVGDGAKIAGHSGIMHDVPAGEAWSGYPGMPLRNHMRVVSHLIQQGQRKSVKKSAKKES